MTSYLKQAFLIEKVFRISKTYRIAGHYFNNNKNSQAVSKRNNKYTFILLFLNGDQNALVQPSGFIIVAVNGFTVLKWLKLDFKLF